MALRLIGEVALDGSGWESGLRRITRATGDFALDIKNEVEKAFGVATVATAIFKVAELAKKTIELGEKLTDTSRRVGVGIEALQEYGFAARMTGADLESLVLFIEKLNSARGDPKMDAHFKRLGINESDLRGASALNVTDLIQKISVAVSATSPQSIIGDLRKVGGRSAGQLIPMLQELDELTAKARELGVVMKGSDAVGFKLVADEFKILTQVILVGLAPAISLAIRTIMYGVNELRGIPGFWKDVAARSTPAAKSLGQRFMTSLLGGEPMNTTQTKQDLGDIGKAFTDAGARAETKKNEADSAIDAVFAAAEARQRLLEKIGGMPEFPEAEEKVHKAHVPGRSGESSDALIKVGNFLGASRDTLTGLAQRQVDLLQRIEHNTRGRSHATHFEESIFPQR